MLIPSLKKQPPLQKNNNLISMLCLMVYFYIVPISPVVILQVGIDYSMNSFFFYHDQDLIYCQKQFYLI